MPGRSDMTARKHEKPNTIQWPRIESETNQQGFSLARVHVRVRKVWSFHPRCGFAR